jgi:hypothetical protein
MTHFVVITNMFGLLIRGETQQSIVDATQGFKENLGEPLHLNP